MDQNTIINLCGATSAQRGLINYKTGYVLKVTSAEDFHSIRINAVVRGRRVYNQSIEINKEDGSFFGLCSCPMARNCKHVASVMFHFLDKQATTKDKPHIDPVDAWLQQLGSHQHPDSQNTNRQQVSSQFLLLYILEPSISGATLNMSVKKVRRLKKGGYGKAADYSLDHLPQYGYSSDFISPEDRDIALLVNDQENHGVYGRYHGSRYILSGDLGQLALRKVLDSGRCHFHDKDTQAVQSGINRTLSFEWIEEKHGKRLKHRVEPSATDIFKVGSMWYCDAENNCLGELETGSLDLQQITALLAAPLIPKEKLEEVSRHFLIDMPSYDLPTPVELDLKKISIKNEKPKFQLRLISREEALDHTDPHGPTRRFHCALLEFNYGTVNLTDEHTEKSITLQQENTIYHIERDLKTEQSAADTLLSLDLQQLQAQTANSHDGNETVQAGSTVWLPEAESLRESAERWSELLSHEFPKLQEQAWEIITDDSFQLSFEEPSQWHAELEESEGSDWFSLSFGIELNGEQLNLLPTLVSMLAEYESVQALRSYLREQEHILVLNGDSHWLKLPCERILPMVETLIELYDHETLDDEGRLLLSRHQGIQLNDLLNDPQLRWHGAEELQDLTRRLHDFKGIAAVKPPENFHAELRAYQQTGLNWLQFLREYQFNGILADDMGLGKTVQTIAHLLLEKQSGRMQSPSLVIAPTSLVGNWRREIERFAQDLSLLILHGGARHGLFDQIDKHDIVLTTYPLVRRDHETLLQQHFHYIVLDEAQYIKNPKSSTAQTVYQLQAKHRLCLTGTPMENHLGELWSIYHFLMPGFLGDLSHFNQLFRKPIENEMDGYRQDQLNKRLSPFLLRRTKQEVLTELPEKTEIISTVALQEKQRDLYESVRLAMDKKVREEIARKGLARSQIMILDALLKLRQTCCDPRIVSLPQAKMVDQSAKLDLLMEMLPEMVAEGRKIILFSQFTKMLGLIEAELKARNIDYSKLTGQTRHRDAAIEKFQQEDTPVFLISLKAGGVGLNLTAADTVIHYDPWWNPAAENQATDRAHRIGQKKAVFVYKLVTEGTVEEKIIALQQKKQALADAIYAQGKGGEKANAVTAEELSDLLGVLN